MTDLPIHSRIVRSWHEWELDGRELRLVLVVETDIEMQPEMEGFDAELMDEVREAAITEMRNSPSAIHLIRIVPPR